MLRNNRKSPHRIRTEITSPLDLDSPHKSKKWIRTRRRSIYCIPIRRKLFSFVVLGLIFIGSLNYSKSSNTAPVTEQKDSTVEQTQKYNTRNTIQLEKSPFFSDESIMIPIYFVNLDSSPDRRKEIENDFANFDEDLKAHLELHRVSAVTIDDVKQMMEENTFLLNNNVTLSAPENRHLPDTYKFGEAACTLSHLKAIKQAYDDGVEVAVVIEDDSLLTNDFAKYWRSYAAEAPSDWSILQLITSNPAVNKRDLHKYGDYWITWEPQHWSTVGYTINRKGMKELLDRLYNSQKGQWRLDEPFILVADEVLYYFTSKPYTSTYPWITARDVETTIAMNLGSKRDLTFGQSETRPNLQVSHTRNESIAVVMSCRLGGENEIVKEMAIIVNEMAILAKANPKSCWFVSVVLVDIELKHFFANQMASLSLPKESFYVSVDDKPFNKFTFVSRIKKQLRMFDFVLFKDNNIYLDGFPWNTFMETKQDSIIAAPYRNNVEISLQRKIKLLVHEPNELVNFQDSALFNKYTSASYKSLGGTSTTYIENGFVLMNSNFAVWFFDQIEDYMDDEIDYGIDNMWCGAAEEFGRAHSTSHTASCILAQVSIHDDYAMRTHKNEEIHKAQLAAMKRYEENDMFARWAKMSSKFRPFTRKIQEIHEICKRNGIKKVDDYWSECFSFFMKHEVQGIQSISKDGFSMLTDLFESIFL